MVIKQRNVGPTKSAVVSDCGFYRYEMRRQWSICLPVCFVGLNPSTADAVDNDPTNTRCINFTKDWGGSGLIMVNLFAYRETKRTKMFAAAKRNINIVGPDNKIYVDRAINGSLIAIAGWGNDGAFCEADELIASGKLHYLEPNKNASPKHPLYIKADTQPESFA